MNIFTRTFTIMFIAFGYIASVMDTNVPGNENKIQPVVVVHGGAYNIRNGHILYKIKGIHLAAEMGHRKLVDGGSALDAVEEAIRFMELDEYFNAGYGSALTRSGDVEMDASIMNGRDLSAGCIALAKDILHPITLARRVKDKSGYNFLAGGGLTQFAIEHNFHILPHGSLITNRSVEALKKFKNELEPTNHESGGVGAVAIDLYGNVAAGASSGGTIGKMTGSISESGQLGAAIYADNSLGAISATGYQAAIMKYNLALRILQFSKHSSTDLTNATAIVLANMKDDLNKTAGAITLDLNGNVGVHFTTRRMAWAYRQGQCIYYGINFGDKNKECSESVDSEEGISTRSRSTG